MTKLLPKYGIAIVTLAATVAGCATSNDRYPSLAIRDFERVQGTFEVANEVTGIEPPAPASATDITEAVQLVDQARLSYQGFLDLLPAAKEKMQAARGLGPDENAWAEGQLAFADLVVKRGEVATFLSNLDLMFADASGSYRQLSEIDEAREIVRQFVAEEDSILSKLSIGE